MKEKKVFVPTRTCPHPWCKPLHLAPLPFALAMIAFDMWHNWLNVFLFAAAVAGGWWVPKLVHYRPRPRSSAPTVRDVIEDIRSAPSAIDLEMEDARYEGTGWRVLEIRKSWARVAVGCDILLVLLIGMATRAMLSDPREAAREASEDMGWETLVALAIGLAFFGFNLYAHKKATQPRKPKRAWLPAFLRTNV